MDLVDNMDDMAWWTAGRPASMPSTKSISSIDPWFRSRPSLACSDPRLRTAQLPCSSRVGAPRAAAPPVGGDGAGPQTIFAGLTDPDPSFAMPSRVA
jgi:hypothetical protein